MASDPKVVLPTIPLLLTAIVAADTDNQLMEPSTTFGLWSERARVEPSSPAAAAAAAK